MRDIGIDGGRRKGAVLGTGARMNFVLVCDWSEMQKGCQRTPWDVWYWRLV